MLRVALRSRAGDGVALIDFVKSNEPKKPLPFNDLALRRCADETHCRCGGRRIQQTRGRAATRSGRPSRRLLDQERARGLDRGGALGRSFEQHRLGRGQPRPQPRGARDRPPGIARRALDHDGRRGPAQLVTWATTACGARAAASWSASSAWSGSIRKNEINAAMRSCMAMFPQAGIRCQDWSDIARAPATLARGARTTGRARGGARPLRCQAPGEEPSGRWYRLGGGFRRCRSGGSVNCRRTSRRTAACCMTFGRCTGAAGRYRPPPSRSSCPSAPEGAFSY
jgi:hypothetical protein